MATLEALVKQYSSQRPREVGQCGVNITVSEWSLEEQVNARNLKRTQYGSSYDPFAGIIRITDDKLSPKPGSIPRVIKYRSSEISELAAEVITKDLGIDGIPVGIRREKGRRYAPYELFVVDAKHPEKTGHVFRQVEDGYRGKETVFMVPSNSTMEHILYLPLRNQLGQKLQIVSQRFA